MASKHEVVAVDAVLTAGCNLSCSYCFQNAKTPDRRMDWETLRGAVDLLLESRQQELLLNFYGGEPLLEFPLVRRAVAYALRHLGRRRSIRFGIITNGTLLRPETAEFLARHRFKTQISFDGVPAMQELRGRGTHRILDALLSRLRKRHALWFEEDVRVSMTLLTATIPYMAESVAYFITKSVRDIHVSPSSTHEWAWRPERIDELDAQFEKVFKICLAHWRRTARIPFEPFRRGGPKSVHSPQGRAMCGVGKGQLLAVDVDGQVHGCSMFAESFQKFPSEFLESRLTRMRMGDYRDAGFSERLAMYPEAAREARIFDQKQNKYSSYGRCGECRYITTCAVCPVTIGHIPGNTDPDRIPDFQCAYNLVSHKYRERFPAVDDAIGILDGGGSMSVFAT